jgi:hypothetical protein
MKTAESAALARQLWRFYKNAGNQNVAKTCHYFEQMGYKYRTLARILKRTIERNSAELLPKPGRTPTVSTEAKLKAVKSTFETNPNVSVRAAAKELGVSRSTLSDMKVHKLGINAYVKQKAPKYREGQRERSEAGCSRILRRSRGRVIIMDDETYVPLDPNDVHGKQYYHATDPNSVPDANRFKGISKFPQQFMIWQCVDSYGNVSKPFVCIGTMTWQTYLVECIQKRLLPFIRKYHHQRRILFWPDMATCHYALTVQAFLRRKRIPFVERKENAPNVPQARPIEKFWALCKRAYAQRPDRAQGAHSMACIWGRLSREVAKKNLRNLMRSTRKKLKQIRDGGVYACLKK